MASKTSVMNELKSMGTAQNVKIYGRHGVTDKMYGVSSANRKTLKKQIKTDHKLALSLWATGNHDARVFATMIADPNQADDKMLEAWVKDLSDYVTSDALSSYISQTALAQKKMEKWIKSSDEWIATVGWNLLGYLAMKDDSLNNAYFEPYIERIEKKIHKSKNRVRYAMNNAVIAMGMRNATLEKKAMAAAKRIGLVEVDHGETSCKTPDAVDYIKKVAARRKQKAS